MACPKSAWPPGSSICSGSPRPDRQGLSKPPSSGPSHFLGNEEEIASENLETVQGKCLEGFPCEHNAWEPQARGVAPEHLPQGWRGLCCSHDNERALRREEMAVGRSPQRRSQSPTLTLWLRC